MLASDAIVDGLAARAYRIPTDAPEADGTLAWDSTTLVLVTATAAGRTGTGYTYTDAAACLLVDGMLSAAVTGGSAFDVPAQWAAQVRAVRNIGWRGLAAAAISAVDAALWDLKARLLDRPLAVLLGRAREAAPVYGSGGFTTYDDERLRRQLADWVERDGCRAVKMKVGSKPAQDRARVGAARAAIGDADLYVDANGAYGRKEALAFAEEFARNGVTWFEEPVSSDDLSGLRLLRDRAPAGMEIVAGEYGWEPVHFRRLLEAGAVDVLQADATRCGGVTGFLRVAALADAFGLPVSTHTAPALHLPLACHAPRLRNVEWFHDHARIERRLFDGAPVIESGRLVADCARPGFGLEFKEADAARFAA